jgi:hypothetical protein
MARPGRPYNRIQLPPHCTGCNRNADLIKYMKRRDKMVAKTLEAAFEDVIICTLPALLFPPPFALNYPLLTIASANPQTTTYPTTSLASGALFPWSSLALPFRQRQRWYSRAMRRVCSQHPTSESGTKYLLTLTWRFPRGVIYAAHDFGRYYAAEWTQVWRGERESGVLGLYRQVGWALGIDGIGRRIWLSF